MDLLEILVVKPFFFAKASSRSRVPAGSALEYRSSLMSHRNSTGPCIWASTKKRTSSAAFETFRWTSLRMSVSVNLLNTWAKCSHVAGVSV